MFLRNMTMRSTGGCSDQIEKLRKEMDLADAILIGAGAGLSTSAGLTYSGERFDRYFSDFAQKYGITDMYSGGFYPFDTLKEYWAWWSRHIYCNRYEKAPKPVYENLLRLVQNKDYFVLTTNVDHQFQLAGFDKQRLFYTQGDYGLFQCSEPCHNKTYDNKEAVMEMTAQQKDMKIPAKLIPHCPICGKPMIVNLRSDDKFVEDEGWHRAAGRYSDFIHRHKNKRVLYVELGVGANTPVIIKYPFWQMTAENPEAVYVCINYGESFCPEEIESRSVCINADIAAVLSDLLNQ